MPRKFTGQRALRIAVRTLHIGAAAMVLGAAAFDGNPGPWGGLLLVSGFGLVADDLYRYGTDWLRYAQAWAILAKLAILTVGVARPEWLVASMWVALIAGSAIAHAPGAVRQYAFWGDPGPCASRGLGACAHRPPAEETVGTR